MTARKPPAIISIDEFDEPCNFLLYGNSGCGKTPFALSAPDCLVLRTDPGTMSAKRLGRKADIWPCKTWDDFVQAYQWLKRNTDHGYKWVIIDTLPDAQYLLMRSVIDTARTRNSNRDEDIPAIQDYQKWYNAFKRYVRMFNDLPVNCLYIAHSMRKESADGEELVLPNLLGQDYSIAQTICGMMQIIGYMEVVSIGRGDAQRLVRRIWFRPKPPYIARDRYVTLGDVYKVTDGAKEIGNMRDITERIDKVVGAKPATVTATKKVAAKRPAAKRA